MLAQENLKEEKERQQARSFDAIDWSSAECRRLVSVRGRDVVDLFYSEQLDDIREAKAVCGECPVAEDCFALALSNREPSGVWGGALFVNGKPLEVKRPRGRPPKDPALQKTA